MPRGRPIPGHWLWTTRPGAEPDLIAELELLLGPGRATPAGPALVRSEGAPTASEGDVDLTFARQGCELLDRFQGSLSELAGQAARAATPLLTPARPWSLAVWVPDHDATNPLQPRVAVLERAWAEQLRPLLPNNIRDLQLPGPELPRSGGLQLQLVLTAADAACFGQLRTEHALSLVPGGRERMQVAGERPSRAARKLEEALAWFGVAPGPGERCVDLGAAPGGWSWCLLRRGAQVEAVDPAQLTPELLRQRGLVHRPQSAFQFEPAEPADWLCCDMAWRPLEVAALLARWGRRGWARFLVANLKLPMKQKARMVWDLRAVVAAGGWQRIRTRQLYHDREECTLVAHR